MNSLFKVVPEEKQVNFVESRTLNIIKKAWQGYYTGNEVSNLTDPFIYTDFLGFGISAPLYHYLYDNSVKRVSSIKLNEEKPNAYYLINNMLNRCVENCFDVCDYFKIELLVRSERLKKGNLIQTSDSAIDFFVYNIKTYEQKFFTVKFEDINKIGAIIQNAMPSFNAENSNEIFSYCISKIREKSDSLNILYRCCNAGWYRIYNKSFFVLDNKNPVYPFLSYESGISIDYTDSFSLVEVWDKLNSLTSNNTILVQIMLIPVLAILFKLFEDASFPMEYVNFISGPSGSKKTSVAKALFTFMMSSGSNNILSFANDTMVAIERAIVLEGVDNITVIDDVAPQPTTLRSNTQKDQLEMIIRMAGGGLSRNRSNSNLDIVHGEGVHGEIVITGELSALSNSSSLRCNHIHFGKNDIHNDALSWLQANRDAIGFFFANFLMYVEINYDRIVQLIQTEFNIILSYSRHQYCEPRIARMYTIQYIAYHIFASFLCNESIVNSEDLENHYRLVDKALHDNAIFNINFSQQTSLYTRFCRAIENAKESGKLIICNNKSDFKSHAMADGFLSDNSLLIKREAMFKSFVDYDKFFSGDVNWNVDSLIRSLTDGGLIISHPNGDRKTYEKRIDFGDGKKIPFVDISIDKFNESLNS